MNVNEDLVTKLSDHQRHGQPLQPHSAEWAQSRNRDTYLDGDGGCMEFDTGLSGTQTLTLTNVTLQNCDVTDGNGGGIAGFNTQQRTGLVTITNSIVQGNKAFQRRRCTAQAAAFGSAILRGCH